MVKSLLAAWAIMAVGIGVAAAVVPGVDVHDGVGTLLWLAVLYGLVNALLGPVLRLLFLPLNALTLGLFGLVINGVLLAATAGLSDELSVGGLLGAIVAAVVISAFATVMAVLFDLLGSRSESLTR